jgi:hypothetical protein
VTLNKLIQYLICHNCGTSIERDLTYRTCSNCFACTGCEIYTCPGCATEILVKAKKDQA